MTDAELTFARDEAARRYRSARRLAELCSTIGLVSAVTIVGLLWAPFFFIGAAAAGVMARRQKALLDELLVAA